MICNIFYTLYDNHINKYLLCFMYYTHIICTIIFNNTFLFIYFFAPTQQLCAVFSECSMVEFVSGCVTCMCNTHSCSEVEQLMTAGNDEFGFTHITDPLDLSLGFGKEDKVYLAM